MGNLVKAEPLEELGSYLNYKTWGFQEPNWSQ